MQTSVCCVLCMMVRFTVIYFNLDSVVSCEQGVFEFLCGYCGLWMQHDRNKKNGKNPYNQTIINSSEKDHEILK